jgi:hypothetical protein
LEGKITDMKVPFGNRQAGLLGTLPLSERLGFIAEGLPIILASAHSYWTAATSLEDHGREARVLEGFAEEEASKVLILMDMVRCPERLVAQCASRIARTFYSHLGRLIYAEAQGWRPVNLAQLRAYVDETRRAHDLEGYAGELIMPNWNRYSRESAMYADIELHEDRVPRWNEPRSFGGIVPSFRPLPLELAEAMQAVGVFDLRGLEAVNQVWGTLEFQEDEHFDDSRRLTKHLFDLLDQNALVTAAANEKHAHLLMNRWQMPMYHLDFKELAVGLEELEQRRDAALWAEMAC